MAKPKKSGTSRDKTEQGLRIAVKLNNSAPKGLKELSGLDGLGKVEGAFRLLPLIESVKPKQLAELLDMARQIDAEAKLPDFSLWHQIISPAEVHPDELASALRQLDIVETAYVMRPVPPPVDPSHRHSSQVYLDPAPNGIDALYAWGPPAMPNKGGDGAGIGFVDMEQGWNLKHEDLPAGITLIPGSSNTFYHMVHGTSVLGEILMVDNVGPGPNGKPIGGLGIAPSAVARVVSQWRTTGSYNNADAIVSAVSSMAFGDVLLLEAQEDDPATVYPTKVYPGYLPVEVKDGTYDAILLATALGIVVVEAAGNGTNGPNDLNAYTTKPTSGTGKKIFDRNSIADFRDSGAIMVGAGASTTVVAVSPLSGSGVSSHEPFASSNYGNRIDCYAWGENIYTTSTDAATGTANYYRSDFNATSGASAIVAGAALIVQAMAQASLGYRFSPRELRRILKINGTPSTTRQTTPPTQLKTAADVIGVMPNLNAIIAGKELNLAPDLYLRDYVGDVGDPTTGIVSQSPDIIVRQAAVADPETAFGASSGTQNNPALSQNVAASQTNFVYVRVLNRGGSDAKAVEVDLYWAPPATLVTPNLWSYIGTAKLPAVPTGRVLTVSDAIPWQNSPGPGHYCFVGVAGNPEDPKPGISPSTPNQFFKTFDDYLTFVENNNNVVWRNFDVVVGPPPPPPDDASRGSGGREGSRRPPSGFYARQFLVPGAFDTGHIFELEALGGLPEGSRAFLETPDWFADALRSAPCEIKRNAKTRTARIPLNPAGLQRIGSVMLHAGSMAECSLLVQIPKESRQHGYEFGVRQLYNKREVGRITWRFAALSKENPRKKTPKAAASLT